MTDVKIRIGAGVFRSKGVENKSAAESIIEGSVLLQPGGIIHGLGESIVESPIELILESLANTEASRMVIGSGNRAPGRLSGILGVEKSIFARSGNFE